MVLSEHERVAMELELNTMVPHKELRGTRVVFRSGSAMSAPDLMRVSAHKARSVAIMARPGDADKVRSSLAVAAAQNRKTAKRKTPHHLFPTRPTPER